MEKKLENKVLLRRMVANFPLRSNYADIVAKRLSKKPGSRVTKAMVYQSVTGKTYNPVIAWTIAVLFRFYRMRDHNLNKALKKLVAA